MTVERAERLASKDVVGIAPLSPDEIQLILDTAEELLEVARRPIKKVPALRGMTVVNLFMEPSTRTRFSFEVAEKRLSADTLNFSASASSWTLAWPPYSWSASICAGARNGPVNVPSPPTVIWV